MSLLRFGSKGGAVSTLQRQLKGLGYVLEVDGDFGPATEKAVRDFQYGRRLIADGIVGPKTLKALRGGDCAILLSAADLAVAAVRLSVELAAVYAVNEVESRGEGFFAAGKPAILFERHVMRRRLSVHKQRLSGWPPDLVSSKAGGYLGGPAEYRRLDQACQIHEVSALESCSWGAFQIMGYHWEFLGYESVHDFVARMKTDEAEHLEAFVRFIERNPTLHQALQRKDWSTFAEGYNGPAYRRHGYHHRLADAYERHKEVA
ncbi:N-acetylmuramidase family protein [Oceanimonas pelagia]|uniref:N-acetylmuramidase family protein n=1 Tax=Oceanimonas pelagia TaxID=3028314 RepID=A0AA50KQB4_9GAMM|nr:N-acetylmuramidase family protein [Oceanimonas pelagia]WMC11758.1 N-acetylmuramidase family protein [Oceanimonas pelagia]